MNDDIIDYAYPTMQAEKSLQALHQYALNKDYFEAKMAAQMAMLQCSAAYSALLVMEQKEKENGTKN